MKYNSILIKGSKKFIKETVSALDLIKNKSRRDYMKIKRYLKVIEQSKQSEMVLQKAKFKVANPSAYHSLEWYASIIVHDVHHYYLHYIKKLKWEPKNFLKHEHLSIDEQLRFLRKIKAPKLIITHLEGAYKRGHWRPSFQKKHKRW